MRDVRVAVLGAGRPVGRELARELFDVGALGTVVDPSHTIRERVGRAPRGDRGGQPERAFRSGSIDAVVIATSAETHADLPVEALRAGKDVFVEEPLLTIEDAERVVKEAEAADRILMVGIHHLYHSAIPYLKEFLASGDIGRVASLCQDRLDPGTGRTMDDDLWSLFAQDVARILYLTGQEPIHTATWGQRITQSTLEDDMHLHMRFPDGTEAHVHTSCLWPQRRRRLTMIGTEASAVYDEDSHTVELHRRRGNPNLSEQEDGREVVFQGDGTPPIRHEVEHFLASVGDRTEPRAAARVRSR